MSTAVPTRRLCGRASARSGWLSEGGASVVVPALSFSATAGEAAAHSAAPAASDSAKAAAAYSLVLLMTGSLSELDVRGIDRPPAMAPAGGSAAWGRDAARVR